MSALRHSIETTLGGALKNRGGALTPRRAGMGEKGRDFTFFFWSSTRPTSSRYDARWAARYVAKRGARADFDPDALSPHVTLGFTKRDLLEQDGVIKSVASRPKPSGLDVQP